jgi:hypothetical protein
MLEAWGKFSNRCTRRDFIQAAGALGLGMAAQPLLWRRVALSRSRELALRRPTPLPVLRPWLPKR